MRVRVRFEPGVSTATTDNGALIMLCEATGTMHQCNPTATVIWTELVKHDGDTDAAALAVAAYYDADIELVRTDLNLLVDRLDHASLVRVER
ncbi:PqqD family peptide modification chaperone [Actinosynnema sp. CS-041913]|uniref:PqqD family peptide modification chaperone n=1 Tax=Actinosynnema sp. CS-041913 TaxID=3239917 RepID=UPI003D9130E0